MKSYYTKVLHVGLTLFFFNFLLYYLKVRNMSHISYCFIKVSRYKTWFCYHTRYLMPQEMFSDDSDSDEENVDTVITAMYYRLKLKCFRNLIHRQSSTSLLDYYFEVEVSAFLLQFWIHKESFWKLPIKTLNNVNSYGSFLPATMFC